MPRRKYAKRATKMQKARTNVATIQKLEKDFLRSPAKLAKQLNKEVASLKQKDTRIKKAVAKLDATANAASKRIQAAENSRNTAAGKKKYNKAKKNYGKANKLLAALNKQQNKNDKLLNDVTNRHEKILAIRKQLAQFEKEWANRTKKKPIQITAKPKKAKAIKTKVKEAFTEAPKYDTFETVTSDVVVAETTEATS